MMNIYKYYSEAWKTEVTVTYENGWLKSLDKEFANPGSAPKVSFYQQEEAFLEGGKAAGTKITKVLRPEPTFEDFWEAYGNKVDRQDAEKKWNKLSYDEKLKAFDYIPRMKNRKKLDGTAIKYPSTYLNKKSWNE